MNPYLVARLVHIFGALGLFVVLGSEWATHLALGRARTTGEVKRILPGFGLAKITGPFSGVFVVLPGFYMTWQISGWSQPWILLAIAAVVSLGILGGAVSGRRIAAIEQASAGEDRPIPAELAQKIHEPILWTGFALRTTIVLGVVLLMATRPALPGSVFIIVGAVVLGVLLGNVLNRSTAA